METAVSLEFWNAVAPISSNPSGNVIEAITLSYVTVPFSANAKFPIVFNVSGSITLAGV